MALTQTDASHEEFQQQISLGLESDDQALIYKMVGVGVGLVLILSAYLVIMTHKVAGPLYKVSMYFDRMAVGKLGKVTPLRQGDMLQDFYVNFHEMHDAVRARAVADNDQLEQAVIVLRAAQDQADYRGEAKSKLVDALESLDHHVQERKKLLA